MKQLFSGKLAPLTFKIGFVESQFQLVSDAYRNWMHAIGKRVTAVPIQGDFSSAAKLLEPLSMPSVRVAFMATQSPWTAYFDNSQQAADPFPVVSYLAQQLGRRGLIATCIPHTLNTEMGNARGTYGSIQFELFAPTMRQFLNYERSIGLSYDGGKWQFGADGEVQPFEETSQYSKRRITDRFTCDMLARYCKSLAIELFSDQFYCGPGVLLAKEESFPVGGGTMTIAEAQERLGIRNDPE